MMARWSNCYEEEDATSFDQRDCEEEIGGLQKQRRQWLPLSRAPSTERSTFHCGEWSTNDWTVANPKGAARTTQARARRENDELWRTVVLQCGKNDGGRCAASTMVRGGGGEGGRRKSGFPWRWTAGSEEPSVVLNIAWTAVVRRCENGAMVVSRAQRRGGGLQGSRREQRWFETVRCEKKEERKGFCAFQKPTY